MATLSCADGTIKIIRPDELKRLMDASSGAEFELVDVRQPEEYAEGHIPGAVLMPLATLEARQADLPRDRKIILYCRAGHRSMAGALALCGLGFRELYSLEGGINAWPYRKLKGMPEGMAGIVPGESSHRDLLLLSIKLEKGSIEFYTSAVEKVSEGPGRDLFATLVSVEQRHMRKVYERAVMSLGRGALPPWEKLKTDLKADYMEGGIQVAPALALLPENLEDELEALEIAVEREYRSFDFYQRASVFVSDYDTRNFLHKLATEERWHVEVLLNRIADLAK